MIGKVIVEQSDIKLNSDGQQGSIDYYHAYQKELYIKLMFTGTVKLAQIDDYINPGQNCIQPKIMKEDIKP